MSDLYTEVCFAFSADTEARAKKIQTFLEDTERRLADEVPLGDDLHILAASTEGSACHCTFSCEGDSVIVEHEGSGVDVGVLAALLQAAMRRFDMADPIAFEWCCYASRTQFGACGGGAVVVTRQRAQVVSTHDVMHAMLSASEDRDGGLGETSTRTDAAGAFGRRVLALLGSTEHWDSDTLSELGAIACELGLGEANDKGMFVQTAQAISDGV